MRKKVEADEFSFFTQVSSCLPLARFHPAHDGELGPVSLLTERPGAVEVDENKGRSGRSNRQRMRGDDAWTNLWWPGHSYACFAGSISSGTSFLTEFTRMDINFIRGDSEPSRPAESRRT